MKLDKKKKIIIAAVIAVIIIAIVIYCVVSYYQVEYIAPVSNLQQTKANVSRNMLMQLQNNYQEALSEKRLTEEDITYYEKTYVLSDTNYKGFFISDEDFVYEFNFDLTTGEVELIEYAKSYSIIRYQVETSTNEEEDVG